MKRKIRVLYVAAEISPYAQAGGLGEVASSLPKAIASACDIEVRRVMPDHKGILLKKSYVKDFPVPMGDNFETCVLKAAKDDYGIQTYFIGSHRYFYRDSIYSQNDDGLRFLFFCRAVVEMIKRISFKPDIVHLNDWHTGFLAFQIKKELPKIKVVYTVHNINYQGFVPADIIQDMTAKGLVSKGELFELGWPEWLNFMKAGIIYADKVTTVSPSYSEEMQIPPNSGGMDKLFVKRGDEVRGILNGIDIAIYDPSDTKSVPYPYTVENLSHKLRNRHALREEYNLPNKDVPLVSMITRIDASKGIDLVCRVLGQGIDTFQLLIVGSGNKYFEGILRELANKYPDNIVYVSEYSLALARKLYAASDIYLMPSMYEPCGLGQLYAMRYGAVPVVNPVGGLKDTVVDYKDNTGRSSLGTGFHSLGTGFHMAEYSEKGLVHALERAVRAYYTPEWQLIVQRCMSLDYSWGKSAQEYYELYSEILKKA